jgi:hypothetical protein
MFHCPVVEFRRTTACPFFASGGISEKIAKNEVSVVVIPVVVYAQF